MVPLMVPHNARWRMDFGPMNVGLKLVPGCEGLFLLPPSELLAKLGDPTVRKEIHSHVDAVNSGFAQTIVESITDWVVNDTGSGAVQDLVGRTVSQLSAKSTGLNHSTPFLISQSRPSSTLDSSGTATRPTSGRGLTVRSCCMTIASCWAHRMRGHTWTQFRRRVPDGLTQRACSGPRGLPHRGAHPTSIGQARRPLWPQRSRCHQGRIGRGLRPLRS